MNSDTWVLIAVIVVCFVAGYAIISFIIGMLKSSGTQEADGRDQNQARDGSLSQPHDYREEQRYAAVLGLGSIFTTDEVKSAFHKQIAKYHPDKVNHLGDEFKKISETKTSEIMEAYDYFKRIYNIR